MRRALVILAMLAALSGVTASAQSLFEAGTTATTPRLVVFEDFARPT